MKKGVKGRAAGCGAPAAHFCSQCPDLAQHVDTESQPDLKLRSAREGKKQRDSRIRASTAHQSYRFICSFLSDRCL